MELQDAIKKEICHCTRDCAVKLAALQCHVENGCYNKNVHKPGFLELSNLLPCEYVKVKRIELEVLEAYRNLELSESDNAKSEYIRLCTTLDRCGITLYLVQVWIYR